MPRQIMGQGQAKELPFDIGECFSCLSGRTIWSVHAGRRKADGEPVTVFVFNFTGRSENETKQAQSAHLRLKTLRHPNILRYIDGIELPTCIYVVTEEATPLEEHLKCQEGHSDFSIAWGLHQTIKALSFLSKDCSLVHRGICLSSVFVDGAGEWKLAGVEWMHASGDSPVPPKTLELLQRYDPPEVGKPAAAKRTQKWSTDMWGLGCLVWEVFNGLLPRASALRNTSKLPKSLVSHYCEMVSANPKSRPNPSDLLSSLREHGGYLSHQFISIALRTEELQIMEPSQREEFFTELNKSLDSFPERFSKRKILPQLLNAFEFGGAGRAILAPLFKLGRLLEGSEYQKKIVPCVVKLFSSTDRATRLNLLQQLEHFIGHLQPSTVNDQIFPNVATGFTDNVPAIREQTIKSMLLIVPKLSESTINTQLLKHLAKCQMDEQPGIRTNTTVCLGKLAQYLSPSSRHKILASAFLRALKDPFPPARCAGIGAMATTSACYTTSDVATRLLPALCTMTMDKEKTVRDQVFKTIKMFLEKMERLSEDPEAAAQQQKEEAAASSWTGWAVSSLTSKFYRAGAPSGATGGQQKPPPQELAAERGRGPPAGETRDEAPVRTGGSVPQGKAIGDVPPQAEGKDWEDDDAWEDFDDIPSQHQHQQHQQQQLEGGEVGGGGSAGEEWEDDGWEAFEEPLETPKATAAASSGPDFFDTFQGSVSTTVERKSEDFFGSCGAASSSRTPSGSKERSPPPPVASSLFEPRDKTPESEGGGWGDWGEDFTEKPTRQAAKKPLTTQSAGSKAMKLGAKTEKKAEPPLFTMATQAAPTTSGKDDGWDFGSDWGSFDPPAAPSKPPHKQPTLESGGGGSAAGRQELLAKRKEERRLKQQAAREKRATGVPLKPGGLGAVKKD